MNQFFKGLNDYLNGHQLMMSEKWFKWLLLPGLISALLFPILLYVFYIFLSPQAWLPLWLQGYFGASIQIIASILFTVISCWALQPLIIILLSPLFGVLAEKVEFKLPAGIRYKKDKSELIA